MPASGYGFSWLLTALLAVLLVQDDLVFKTSQTDITPPELLTLGGYTERGEAVFEPGGERLYARTFLFGPSTRPGCALVSVEMLTIPESLVDAVHKRMPDVRLMLVATHTHSAPDSQMLNDRMTFKVPGIATFKRKWLDWYADKIADGINAAINSKGIDARRLMLATATVDANQGRREGAVPDKTATYLTLEGKPLITFFPAHGTVLGAKNLKTDGDWPGRYAAHVGGIVLPGAIGDVTPELAGTTDVEKCQNIVDKLSAGLKSAQVWDLSSAGATMAYLTEDIALARPVPHPDFAKTYGASEPFDQVLIEKFAPTKAHVSLLRLGDLVVVGIPGEPTSELGRRIVALGKKWGFPHTVVVSHCNGWIGYILEPEDYDRGGYEATLAFHGRETSQRVLDAVEKGLSKMRMFSVERSKPGN